MNKQVSYFQCFRKSNNEIENESLKLAEGNIWRLFHCPKSVVTALNKVLLKHDKSPLVTVGLNPRRAKHRRRR